MIPFTCPDSPDESPATRGTSYRCRARTWASPASQRNTSHEIRSDQIIRIIAVCCYSIDTCNHSQNYNQTHDFTSSHPTLHSSPPLQILVFPIPPTRLQTQCYLHGKIFGWSLQMLRPPRRCNVGID